MNKQDCEEIMIALLAVFDGEETDLSPEELNRHTAACADCRREVEEMQKSFNLLRAQQRAVSGIDLWPRVEQRIGRKTSWRPFVFPGALLVAYKLLEMFPETDFGFVFKIVPLLVIAGLFVLLRENPFRINTELISEK